MPPRLAVSVPAALVAALLAVAPARAQMAQPAVAPTAPSAGATRATVAPTIDGRLDEPVWQAAPALSGLVQREPVEGRPESERTEVRILYDGAALYIGAWLFDSDPAGIMPGEARRDANLAEGDAFQVVLDTYLDRQNGFLFATTPGGIEHDAQITREGQAAFATGTGQGVAQRAQAGSGDGFNKNWDASWTVATTRDQAGWYAEFRIPFSTLRYGAGPVQTWGLNFARSLRRRNEEAYWAPVSRQYDIKRISQAGTLTGLEVPEQRILTVTPYVLGSSRRDYAVDADAAWKGELGGDAKIGLTPALTLDLTYNTDFAQVEVDEEQVNLNRFRLFFPEKRPFFLENAGTFAVGAPREVELFFSRRIGIEQGRAVPIVGGARLTGRAAGFTVGALSIQTGAVDGVDPLLPGGGAPIAAPTNYSVVRAMRELPSRSRVGGILVSRLSTDDTEDYNLTYGADGRLGIGEAFVLDAFAAGTQTPGVVEPEYAIAGTGAYTTREWRIAAGYRQVSEGFNPEVGFLDRPGHRFLLGRVQRTYRPKFAGLREIRPHAMWQEYLDLDGTVQTRWVHIDSHFEFGNGAFFQAPAFNIRAEGLRRPFEIAPGVVIPAGTYHTTDFAFAYNTNLSAPLAYQGTLTIGSFFTGDRVGTDGTLSARIGDRFLASLRLSYNDVDLPEGSFETTLVGVRAAYSFTPSIYVQSLLQYNDQLETFSSNVRLGWLNTAGTGLFIVYNDTEEADFLDRRFDLRGPVERTLVVKYTRLFDLGR